MYLPCVLQTKKRYIGFSYETPEQKDPVFDAKGVETVRRDTCPAVSKVSRDTCPTVSKVSRNTCPAVSKVSRDTCPAVLKVSRDNVSI